MPGSLVPNWLCERFTTRRADISRMNYINYPQRYLENDDGHDDDCAERNGETSFYVRESGADSSTLLRVPQRDEEVVQLSFV